MASTPKSSIAATPETPQRRSTESLRALRPPALPGEGTPRTVERCLAENQVIIQAQAEQNARLLRMLAREKKARAPRKRREVRAAVRAHCESVIARATPACACGATARMCTLDCACNLSVARCMSCVASTTERRTKCAACEMPDAWVCLPAD